MAEEPKVAALYPCFETLEEGRTYKWCACGRSQNQPWCDGSHEGTGLEPLEFRKTTVAKVTLCACKKTKRPPYCDGQHQRLMAEEAAEREERFPLGLAVQDEHSRDVEIDAACPDLPVADCPASIRFYCGMLGFEKVYDDAELGFDRTLFACVQRGHLKLTLNWHRREEAVQKVYVGAMVEDVEALYEEFKGRGVPIEKGLEEHEWGERSFEVRDPDGHSLQFSMIVPSSDED